MYVMKGKPGLFSGAARVHAEMAQDTPNDGDRFLQFTRGQRHSRGTTRSAPAATR